MLREFLRHWNPVVEPVHGPRQSGALPYTVIEGRVVFLLVTSRRTGRWIFPKGSVSTGMTAWDSAAKEALEEAGVVGEIGSEPVGSYQNTDKGLLVDIDLYPLKVSQQFEIWDEMAQRLRHWALLAEAKRLLADRSLARVAERLQRQLTSRRVMQ